MFSSLSWGQSQFDEAVEKATSELRLAEEDIALNLEICDQIRSKSVPPKDAARALRRRLTHRNPNVQLLALALTDVCVKNGGDHFLAEVAGKEFMDNMVSLLSAFDPNPDVRSRILRLVQNWAIAFEGKPALSYVALVYKDLASRGFEFPPKDPALANAAMVDTSTAPEWIDSDVCMRCRTSFSFTNRKHHCRNCGQVFDQQCSARVMPLPHFGITQEVRVCDTCYMKLSARRERKERSQSVDFHTGHTSPRVSRHRHRDAADADLQRAIQLSLAESRSNISQPWHTSEPPLVDRTTHPVPAASTDEDDPELRAAIEASLREAHAPRPSAPEPDPVVYTVPELEPYGVPPPLPVLPNHDLHPHEEDAILTFSQTVQDEPGAARRDLARVHALYDEASGLRPRLALSLDDAGRKEQMLGEMHEKLSHAVKLYDQLLTDQLARPTWQRNAPSRSGTWHGQASERQSGAYMQRHGSYRAEGHPSEAPYHLQHQQGYQQSYQPEPPRSYQPQQPEPSQPYPPVQQQQQPEPYQPAHQQQQPEHSQLYHSQQPESSQMESSQMYRLQHQEPQHLQQLDVVQPYQQPVQPYQQQTFASSSSVSGGAYHAQQTPSQASFELQPRVPATSTHEQYYPQQHQQLPPTVQSPVPQPTAPASAQPPYAVPPTLQSPPATQSYFQPVQSPPPPPQSMHQHSTHSTQSYHHHTMFPTPPTSNPQAFPLYGPGPPVSSLEQTEKKEAALIDL